MTELLSVEDLNFSWGSNEVLKGISFSIKSNEVVAILGVNGAGKSTLIKCINRILKMNSGTVKIQSLDLTSLNLIELSKRMSYVPQTVRTSFSIDVFDVVLLGRRPHINWRVSANDQKIVSETLRFLSLEDFAFRRFDQLSGGERQRVIVAKAIAQGANLLLMDEPTSDLDLKNQISTMKNIVQLISESDDKSALIAIHDINIAARFADRIILLHDGKIVSDGLPSEVLTSENIGMVFGVTSQIISRTDEQPMRIVVGDEIEEK
ncbi:MAG: ABC transporter ATP-binding protein [Candidatus Poseidoniaceae archaeon]|nr:ABC transporter ATP-binding protein [Candidatus Poseidoniaceae archaeon]MDE0870110.1 ABC transporter ATP-binding protein [Candidatus Poseidoniaceae archaeon]|tara:strand:+ start:743 stop:1534 length:792 start_codon:yes stop_codon:yes gene_type:complete